MSFCKLTLLGNLVRDPELRTTPQGTEVCEFAVAHNYRRTVKGESIEKTIFWEVTFFGRQAQTAHQYLKKGQPVLVDGRVEEDTWTDKQSGQERSRLKLIGSDFSLVGAKATNGQEESPRAGAPSPRPRTSPPPAKRSKPVADPDLDVEADAVPF